MFLYNDVLSEEEEQILVIIYSDKNQFSEIQRLYIPYTVYTSTFSIERRSVQE